MIDKIIYIQLVAVFVPVIVDASALSDDDVSHYAVHFSEWQRLMICDLAPLALENESCPEALSLERVLVFADF